jgi:hypothetical protein
MKLTNEELRQILERVEKENGGTAYWLDIPAYIRKDNADALLEVILERAEQKRGKQ